MAFQLKSMIGHMMRPNQQAIAIASNNTDQMLFAAIGPASPTMQAQQQHFFPANQEASKLQHQQVQQRTQSPTRAAVNHQNNHTHPARPSTGGPGGHDTQPHHTSLYAMPQLMNTVPSHHRLLSGPVTYTTTMPQQTAIQPPLQSQNATSASGLAQFYLPPAASEVHARGEHLNQQFGQSSQLPQTAHTAYQQAAYPQVTYPQGFTAAYDYQNPVQQAVYGHHQSMGFQNRGGDTPMPHVGFYGSQNHAYSQISAQPFTPQPQTPAPPQKQPARKMTNRVPKTNKKRSVEQQYFKNEAEAQAWEDQCMGAHFDAPAPKQFLQNVTKRQQKTASTAASKKTTSAKSKVVAGSNATDEEPQVKVDGQSFKMKFKTEICKFWQNTGTCEYQDSCSFAHGSNELKLRQDQPRNYKTKQCKRFHKELYCPYGPRCQFLHDEPGSVKKVKAVEVSALDSNNNDNDEAAASVSYTHLLNNVTEETSLPKSLSEEESVEAAMPASEFAVLDFAKVLQPFDDVPAIEVASSRRLRVFEDMPVSRSNSQISSE